MTADPLAGLPPALPSQALDPLVVLAARQDAIYRAILAGLRENLATHARIEATLTTILERLGAEHSNAPSGAVPKTGMRLGEQ